VRAEYMAHRVASRCGSCKLQQAACRDTHLTWCSKLAHVHVVCVVCLSMQAREVLHTRLAVSNTEQLQQLPLLYTWGAAAAADAPQQPEGWTLLPSGVAGDTRVTLQQAAAWGVPVTSPFDWQQAQFTVGPQQEEEDDKGSRQQPIQTSWADLQVCVRLVWTLRKPCTGLALPCVCLPPCCRN
jgi:hypothetical protein